MVNGVKRMQTKINSYRDLQVWQRGMDLAGHSYLLTKTFPREEMFGLTSQIRRASTSIPANIAEGYGRENRREFIQFLRIAQGSLKELETHVLLATQLKMANADTASSLLGDCESLGKMLRALIRKLQAKAIE